MTGRVALKSAGRRGGEWQRKQGAGRRAQTAAAAARGAGGWPARSQAWGAIVRSLQPLLTENLAGLGVGGQRQQHIGGHSQQRGLQGRRQLPAWHIVTRN